MRVFIHSLWHFANDSAVYGQAVANCVASFAQLDCSKGLAVMAGERTPDCVFPRVLRFDFETIRPPAVAPEVKAIN
jgi:hypothetical protein